MKKHLLPCFLTLFYLSSFAQTTNFVGPVGSKQFGKLVVVLNNGNYIVTDPAFDDGPILNVGAVYLYNGNTHTLISTLKGSTLNDQVGSGGINKLTNGNFVIKSPNWNNGIATKAGAITWGSADLGVSGIVSVGNSLVGSTTNDQLGNSTLSIYTFDNGNYIVKSPNWDNGTAVDAGAATWCSGTTGLFGTISSANSLIGSNTNDKIGTSVIILTNGNYVVSSPTWSSNAGASTWGSGASGISGVVSISNSLYGKTGDAVGGITFRLTNGNYVVGSSSWSSDPIDDFFGAVTWCNGTTGRTGIVDPTNSVVGSHKTDLLGSITPLTNGNYVIYGEYWDNGSTADVGVAAWCDGSIGRIGYLNSSNSLIGTVTGDAVGGGVMNGASAGGITALDNGNYLVESPNWGSSTGAVTWCDGSIGRVGFINSGNSLVGSSINDKVGGGQILKLSNGNYVVCSPNWGSKKGAVTWGNTAIGISGVVSSSNSLVGTKTDDQVGYTFGDNGLRALNNGNYVIGSDNWDNGDSTNVGASTWANGNVSITGEISIANSLIGTKKDDRVGRATVVLNNGNYVVRSLFWDNVDSTDVGAVTWCNGATGRVGLVGTNNSLVGIKKGDRIGVSGVVPNSLNSNYLIGSTEYDDQLVTSVGANTWSNGNTGLIGQVNSTNSLIGVTKNDSLGFYATVALNNGDFVAKSGKWDNGPIKDAGAVTYINGLTGLSGNINSCNSVIGTIALGGPSMLSIYNDVYNYLIVGRPADNIVTIFNSTGMTLANNLETATVNINGEGSYVPLVSNNNCRILANIKPMTPNPINGTVNSKVWVETIQPATYVKRHYQIFPTVGAANAKAKVTLYFTQQEFLDYNTIAVNDLPISAGDNQGKLNLRINKIAGESSGGTGLPNSYPGPVEVINPDENDIVYNTGLSRWEVSFVTTGFSGFFVFGEAATPLPLTLIDFSGKKVEAGVQLNWQTTNEKAFSHFEIERSIDTKRFEKIGKKISDESRFYEFQDNAPQPETEGLFYRLKIVDLDGTYNFSKIITVKYTEDEPFVIFPNPTSDYFSVKNNSNLEQIKIMDVTGKILKTFSKNSSNKYSLNGFVTGKYFVRIESGNLLINRKIIVE